MAKVANVEIDQGSYWESVRELLGPKVMNDIMTDMEKAYGLKGMLARFETKEIVETIGKDEVLESIGEKEILSKFEFDLDNLEMYSKESEKSKTVSNQSNS